MVLGFKSNFRLLSVRFRTTGLQTPDRLAFNQQIVSSQVKEGQYVKLKDIFHKDSGKKMDKFFSYEKVKEKSRETMKGFKKFFESKKEDVPPEPDEKGPSLK